MVRAIGIDSGTKTMDIYGFDDKTGEVLIDLAVTREDVTNKPGMIIEKLKEIQESGIVDAIVGPSGYGVPLQKAKDTTEAQIAAATFVTQADIARKLKIIGLRQLMQLMKAEENLNIWFTPGVIQLPTVPKYRKANKIDMGTSDKVPSVIAAVKDQAERQNIGYNQTNFILIEIGFAYTSAMAVKNGQIIDAMAGTAGFPSYLGMGFIDAEVAYALANTVDDFSKLMLFAGGVAAISEFDTSKPIEEFIERAKTEEKARTGLDLLLESIIKDVASLLPSVKPKEIILSGRFTNIPEFNALVSSKLQVFFKEIGSTIEIVKFQSKAKVAKGAAEGAAIFANGIAHGKYEEIINVMQLRESKGSIFGNMYLGEKVEKGLDTFKKL